MKYLILILLIGSLFIVGCSSNTPMDDCIQYKEDTLGCGDSGFYFDGHCANITLNKEYRIQCYEELKVKQ